MYKLLLIEDDKVDQMAFKRMIEPLNYDYKIVGSIKEAQALLETQEFDVVITDYLLGDGTAFEIFDAVSNAPIIFITGHGDQKVTLKAMKIGTYDYLIKDHDRDYLKSLPNIIENAINDKTKEERSLILSHAILDIADSVFITDINNNITFVNKALCKNYGYTDIELLGVNIEKIGETHVSGQYNHLKKDGTILRVSLTRSVILDQSGKNIAIVGVIHDISEHKKIEENLKAAKESAEQASRSKSDFLSIVSHELRTPLTSIRGFTNIIKKRLETVIFPSAPKDDKKIEKAINQVASNLNIMIEETERLTNLINDVLDLAKIEAGKVEWEHEMVDLKEVFERASNATSSLFEAKKLWLKKEIRGEKHLVKGDRDRLIQVATNLFSNAVKFTEMGGVTYKLISQSDSVRCEIYDTGIGIPQSMLESVFEKFKQVGDTMTDRPKGTGLGLPICKEIIAHHGGTIFAESSEGKGSVFVFELPIYVDPMWHFEIEKSRILEYAKIILKDGATGHAASILIVDDNAPIRSMLRQYMEEQGYRFIFEAQDAKSAVANALLIRPDLILLDVSMPDYSGYEVLKVLKCHDISSAVPVIMISALDNKHAGAKFGAIDYIIKTVDEERLSDSIIKALKRKKRQYVPVVMVIENDNNLSQKITDMVNKDEISIVASIGNFNDISLALTYSPDLLLVDEDAIDDNLEEYIEKDAAQRDIPVIIISSTEEKCAKLKLIASDHINKTVDAAKLTESITETLHKRNIRSRHKVLIIDNDPDSLVMLTEMLKARDFDVFACNGEKQDIFNYLRRSVELVLVADGMLDIEAIDMIREMADVISKTNIESPLYSKIIFMKK
jgi:signal transduction histidine kinase/DNA-binding response OmpR family regulator